MPHLQHHTCRSCSAPLAFMPGTLAVRCASCGSVAHVVDETPTPRLDTPSPAPGSATTPAPAPPPTATSADITAIDRYESLLHELERTRQAQLRARTARTRWVWAGIAVALSGVMIVLSPEFKTAREVVDSRIVCLSCSAVALAAGWMALLAYRRSARLASNVEDLDARATALRTAHGLNPTPSTAPPLASDRLSPTLAWGSAVMGALVGKGKLASKRPPR